MFHYSQPRSVCYELDPSRTEISACTARTVHTRAAAAACDEMPFAKARPADAAPSKDAARPCVDFSKVLDLLERAGVLKGAPRDSSPEAMAAFVQGYHAAHEALDSMLWMADSQRASAVHRSAGRLVRCTTPAVLEAIRVGEAVQPLLSQR